MAAVASLLSISPCHSSLLLSPPSLPPLVKNPKFFSSSYRHRSHRRLSPPLRVATPPTAPTPVPEEEKDLGTLEIKEQEEGSAASSDDITGSFSWRDHWYPVSLIEDLDPRRPTPFQLLNREIVLWNDPKTGDWVAFDDRCPHRLAPLSVLPSPLLKLALLPIRRFHCFIILWQEGRIDGDGCLQCSYHGWSFDGKGTCTRIPQASPEGPESRALRSPRANVPRLPTLVLQGLLFVWPDENGWEKASRTKPPLLVYSKVC